MKTGLSKPDEAILAVLRLVRGLRPETATQYPQLRQCGGAEAIRKRMERLKQKGFLASSALPSGSQIFRLSIKGARFTHASPAWASSPTENIAAEMLSVSAFAWRPEFQFMTSLQCEQLLRELSSTFAPPKIAGRFLLTTHREAGSGKAPATGLQLHYWLVELRSADQLAKRIETIAQRLGQNAGFAELMELNLFGVSVAVLNETVKASLAAKTFRIRTNIVVVPELAVVLGRPYGK